MKQIARYLPLALPLIIAGCGDFPRPFQDNPGATAARLSVPPPSRLVVSVPEGSDLPPGGARLWADATAAALTDAEVPTLVENPEDETPGWGATLSITAQTGMIVPIYTVHNATGKIVGTFKGDPVPPATWATETKAGLLQATAKIGQPIADLLTGLEAARQESDPHSLLHRPPRVAITGVTGAPGDGDTELVMQLKNLLPQNGAILQKNPQGADYLVRCEVQLAKVDQVTQRIEIVWIVLNDKGQEAGRVAQLHDIQAGSLDHYWGEIAVEVAKQAAGGIKQVMSNQLITHQRHSS